MNSRYMTDGSLALAVEPARPAFQVIDGYAAAPAGAASAPMRPLQAPARFARLRLAVAALLVAVVAAGATAFLSVSQQRFDAALADAPRTEVTVEAGETLWTIASEHAVEGLGTQETVDIVKAWNDLDSSLLTPGMSLVVPA